MKKSNIILIIILVLFLFNNCQNVTEPNTGEPVIEEPKTHVGTWYFYTEYFYGFAEIKIIETHTEDTFEKIWYGWANSQWKELFGFRGTINKTSDENVFQLTLHEMGIPETPEALTWRDNTWGYFEAYRNHSWGFSSTLSVTYQFSGDNLISQCDIDGDGIISTDIRKLENITSFKNEDDSTHATMDGTYPHIQYAGLGFHNNQYTAAIYIQIIDIFVPYDKDSFDITAEIRSTDDARINIPLTYYPDRYEWGNSDYRMYNKPIKGLWWISKIAINCIDGSKSVLIADNPYVSGYSASITTSAASQGSFLNETYIGQDYAWEEKSNLFYLETFKNGSTPQTSRTDTHIRIYSEEDTEKWFAANNGGGREDFAAGLRVCLQHGKTYYIQVIDIFSESGTYSFKITGNGFNGSSTNTVSIPDKYEPDDTYSEATRIYLNEVQDHSFSKAGESDWFIFTAPN